MSVIFKCRWGLSYTIRAISTKFQFKLQPYKIEKKIHMFRPAALAPLQGETGKTCYHYINSMRTVLASSSRWKGGREAIAPVGCQYRSGQLYAAPSPEGLGKKFFQKHSMEGMDLVPQVTKKAGCPPVCLPKGSPVEAVTVYWVKEVNLHSECFNNLRGYKHPTHSTAAVWFIRADKHHS